MSDSSPVLALPYIQPAQAQKHVTHNEALRVLDAVVQLAVIAADLELPPEGVQDGDRYIVAGSGGGAWAGQGGAVAVFAQGAWFFVAPQPGWRARVLTPAGDVVFDADAGWQPAGGGVVTATPRLGINATADATNRLSLSAPATLLNHEGGGHQLKLNKAGAGDTASLLYQTAFSGRAEMGLAGDDDFAVKVSADGTTWREALRVDGASGSVAAPGGVESLQLTVAQDTVAALVAPSSGGFAFISSVGSAFPQGTASMVVCYDVGPSPQLLMVWAGSDVVNLGTTLPTGTSAAPGRVGIAAGDDGTLYLENRHGSGSSLQYCITWLNGWRPLG